MRTAHERHPSFEVRKSRCHLFDLLFEERVLLLEERDRRLLLCQLLPLLMKERVERCRHCDPVRCDLFFKGAEPLHGKLRNDFWLLWDGWQTCVAPGPRSLERDHLFTT